MKRSQRLKKSIKSLQIHAHKAKSAELFKRALFKLALDKIDEYPRRVLYDGQNF